MTIRDDPFLSGPPGPSYAPDDYGGGGRGSTGLKYFYLVIKSGVVSHVSGQEVQRLYKTAVNTDENYIFVLVDISTDRRLAEDLAKAQGGPELYAQIEANAPVFLISPKRIPELETMSTVEVLPIKNYEKDIDFIYAKMGLNSATFRTSGIAFLKELNNSVILNPTLFGVGLNLNHIISSLLERAERVQP
jgi:hypothetical protein